MARVTVVHWNPRRHRAPGRLSGYLAIGARINNFGDLLGPMVVDRMLAQRMVSAGAALRPRRLLTVGSIMHFARRGDVVWGSGINGKESAANDKVLAEIATGSLDVRAVRGPATAQRLGEYGIEAPAVYGDPALLLPRLVPELSRWAADKRREVTVVPNFNDLRKWSERQRNDPRVLDPCLPVWECLERIARSEFVVGSSLHGIVVAESLGIPARMVRGPHEHAWKYDDYYGGTGRTDVATAQTVDEAIEMGGAPGLNWDPQPLLDAFPFDLWAEPVGRAA